MKHIKLIFYPLFISLLIISCKSSSDDDDKTSSTLAIIGNYIYNDTYGNVHNISSTTWSYNGDTYFNKFSILKYDNNRKYLIVQNDENNSYNENLYSRFDWAFDNEKNLYYCETAYNAANAIEAEEATSDSSDLTTGCGGTFPWSKLTKFTELVGDYVDSEGVVHEITATFWKQSTGNKFHIIKIDPSEKYLIAYNDSSNDSDNTPDKYSRFHWMYKDNHLYFCQTAFKKDSITDAENVEAPTIDSLTGCINHISNGPWTMLW